MKKFITHSSLETQKLASSFAKKFSGQVVALSGDLGSGKTTFVQGFAKGLGIKDKIISPTFVLMRIHKIPRTKNLLYHIDLYRLENPEHIKSLGIEDLFHDPQNIILIEWAEKIKSSFPKNTLKIKLKSTGDTTREITLF